VLLQERVGFTHVASVQCGSDHGGDGGSDCELALVVVPGVLDGSLDCVELVHGWSFQRGGCHYKTCKSCERTKRNTGLGYSLL
jgi:hypothetical protein